MKQVGFVFLFVCCVFGDTGEDMSVKEGENVTLSTDVKQPNETMKWYFNDTLIALINGEASKSCLYDGEGEIFRGRLQVDYETGSLTITNITTEHTGRYEANIIRSNSTGKRVSLNRTSSGLSSGVLAGIVVGVVGVVLVVAAAVGVIGVMINHRRSSSNVL